MNEHETRLFSVNLNRFIGLSQIKISMKAYKRRHTLHGIGV